MTNTPLFELTMKARWRLVTIVERMTKEARESMVELVQEAHDLGYAEGFAAGFAEGGKAEQTRVAPTLAQAHRWLNAVVDGERKE